MRLVGPVCRSALLSVVALVLWGCPTQPPARERIPNDDPEPELVAPEPEVVQPLVSPWQQCADGFEISGTPEADLERLTQKCASALGQRVFGPVRAAEQAENDAVQRFSFTAAEAGQCVRVLAVGDKTVQDLSVELVGPDGQRLGADALHKPYALAPAKEPLCVSRAGLYSVEVSVYRGKGRYAIQIWTGAGSAKPPASKAP